MIIIVAKRIEERCYGRIVWLIWMWGWHGDRVLCQFMYLTINQTNNLSAYSSSSVSSLHLCTSASVHLSIYHYLSIHYLPANSNCGTNNNGANSVASFTSDTKQPINTATEQLAAPNPHAANTMKIKDPCKLIM